MTCCWIPAISQPELPSTGLTRFHTSSNGSSAPPSRAVPEKRTLAQCFDSFGRDVHDLGVDVDDLGGPRGAARLHLANDLAEQLRRHHVGERLRVVAVVRRLDGEELLARLAREGRARRSPGGSERVTGASSAGPPNTGSKRVGGGTCVS